MNHYDVEWEQVADDALAQIWTTSIDRKAVTSAAHEVDQKLARDPRNVGQELSEGLRKLRVGPLVVIFSIDEARRTVEVSRVRSERP